MTTKRMTEEQHKRFCYDILSNLEAYPSLRLMFKGFIFKKHGRAFFPNHTHCPMQVTVTSNNGKMATAIFEFAGKFYLRPIYINFIHKIVMIGNQVPSKDSFIEYMIRCAELFFRRYPEILTISSQIQESTSADSIVSSAPVPIKIETPTISDNVQPIPNESGIILH